MDIEHGRQTQRGEGEDRTGREVRTDIHTLPRAKQTARRSLLHSTERSAGRSVRPRGVRSRMGEELQGGEMCIHVADSPY